MHGKNNFVFLVLQTTDDPLDLSRYEEESIRHYAKNGNLYNIVLVVPKVHHSTGYKLSEETRQRQSAAKRGKKRKRLPIEKTRARLYKFVSPDGDIVECLGLKELCDFHHLNLSHMGKVANGKLKRHKGWRRG